mgnify:CR=1 FL=1
MAANLSSRQIILAGFAAVALFMLAMLGLGLSRLAEVNAELTETVSRTFRRVEAVYTMRMVARDRLASLQSLFFIADPFARDAEYMRYGRMALSFIEARDTFLGLSPAPAQRAAWQEARILIQEDEKLHQQAIDLLFDGQSRSASQLLQQRILPLEAKLTEVLEAMLEIERKEVQARLERTYARYRHTLFLLALLTGVTLVVIAASAAYVTRHSGRTEGLLQEEKRRAEAAAEKLAWAANHDALTGLVNRRLFEVRLNELLRSAREEAAQHALAYLDLDRFKGINDRYGHEAGDQLLVTVARAMERALPEGAVLARLGGDEFGLLLPHCGVDKAEKVVQALRQAVAASSLPWGEHLLTVGLSAGVVGVDPALTATELVCRADVACYEDKGRRTPG